MNGVHISSFNVFWSTVPYNTISVARAVLEICLGTMCRLHSVRIVLY